MSYFKIFGCNFMVLRKVFSSTYFYQISVCLPTNNEIWLGFNMTLYYLHNIKHSVSTLTTIYWFRKCWYTYYLPSSYDQETLWVQSCLLVENFPKLPYYYSLPIQGTLIWLKPKFIFIYYTVAHVFVNHILITIQKRDSMNLYFYMVGIASYRIC